MKNVLVIGSGGVGTIAALLLSLNRKANVTLVVRLDYDKVKAEGISIRSKTYGSIDGWKPQNVARSVTEAAELFGPFDFILLTTKNIPDGPMTCEDVVRPAVLPQLVIIMMQNGLGIEEPMMQAFPDNIILLAVLLIALAYKNGVVENPGKDHVTLGDFRAAHKCSLPGTRDAMEGFIEIYRNPDQNVNYIAIDDDCRTTRWQKLVYNSVFNVVTAILETDVTRCQIAGLNDSLFRPAMQEVIDIAASEGVTIPKDTIERFIHIGDGMFYSPLMCVDRRKNQLIEMEVILGNPLRIARKNGVQTPILLVLYQLLKVVQFKTKEATGAIKIDPKDYQYNSDDYPNL